MDNSILKYKLKRESLELFNIGYSKANVIDFECDYLEDHHKRVIQVQKKYSIGISINCLYKSDKHQHSKVFMIFTLLKKYIELDEQQDTKI